MRVSQEAQLLEGLPIHTMQSHNTSHELNRAEENVAHSLTQNTSHADISLWPRSNDDDSAPASGIQLGLVETADITHTETMGTVLAAVQCTSIGRHGLALHQVLIVSSLSP
jgi:hypothetical protein